MSTSPTPEHPEWCSPAWCTAGQEGGVHRSAPAVFSAPAVEMKFGLHQGERSIHTFMTLSAYLRGDANGLHATLAIDDADRLSDTLTGLLERAR